MSTKIGKTRAGTAKTVITPPVGYRMGQWALRQGRSTGVYRDLYARALVVSDGVRRLAIVSLEVCGLPAETVSAVKKKVRDLTGIEAQDLIISSTHNHTAQDILIGITPEWQVYAAYLADLVAGAVAEAAYVLRPVVVGHASGKVEGWTVNRQNKDDAVDTEMGVLAVNEPDGAPFARVVNFAAHGVCDGGQYLEWSGDFAGELSALIEDIDTGATALFLQGAAGDIHPFDWWFGNRDSKRLHTHEDTALFAETLAREALRLAGTAETFADAPISTAASEVVLPRRRVSWTVDEARALHTELTAKLPPYSGGVWPDGTTTAIAGEDHPEIYGNGRNELALAKNQDAPPVIVNVQAARIGDLLISAHPGELFNQLGLAIKEGHSGPRPWVASYCGEYVGYVSSRAPYREIENVPLGEIVDMSRFRRLYGTTTSPFSPDAGELLVDAALDTLAEL